MKDYFRSHFAIRDEFNPVINAGRLFQQVTVDMQLQTEMNNINFLKLQRGNKKKITEKEV